MSFQEYNDPYRLEEMFKRVGFGRRLGAYIIDFIINTILFGILFFVTGAFESMMDSVPTDFSDPGKINTWIEIIKKDAVPLSLLLSAIYYSMEIFFAATPGKMALNIKIANEDRSAASIYTLFIRFLVKHSNFVLTFLYVVTFIDIFNTFASIASLVIVVGFFFVLGEKRQAFHDIAAKTAVFSTEEVIEEKEVVGEPV